MKRFRIPRKESVILFWSRTNVFTSRFRWCSDVVKGCYSDGRLDIGVVSYLKLKEEFWNTVLLWNHTSYFGDKDYESLGCAPIVFVFLHYSRMCNWAVRLICVINRYNSILVYVAVVWRAGRRTYHTTESRNSCQDGRWRVLRVSAWGLKSLDHVVSLCLMQRFTFCGVHKDATSKATRHIWQMLHNYWQNSENISKGKSSLPKVPKITGVERNLTETPQQHEI